MFKLYNTLTKKIEEVPKKDHLNLYTCGPTVYNFAHIGNLRAFIMADLLYRTLKYEGFNPRWVMNITDIDDKTIKGTLKEYGKDAGVKELFDFTEKYLKAFKQDLKEVNVSVGEIEMIRVTDKMADIQDFILKLLEKGFAYKADDGVYFSIEKYQTEIGDYGQLVGEKFLEGKKVGARVAVDEYEKDNLSDFALWKFHNPEADGQIFWPHPTLGNGRPGWHIECSVINRAAFKGEPTDIHTGGVDLIFPHHTNEIAQSQALFGKGNFVKHWFHSEHLLVDGKKMAKRDGNFYTLKDILEKGFSGVDLRFLFFGAHYRVQQNFTWNSLASGHIGLDRSFGNLDKNTFSQEQLMPILNNDLAVSEAVAAVLAKDAQLSFFDEIFAVGSKSLDEALPDAVLELSKKRLSAREQKDFAKSDELRKQMEAMGYEVMDTREGQKVKKKIQI